MTAHLYMALPQGSGDDRKPLFRVRLFEPAQGVGEQFAKSPMDFHEAVGSARGWGRQTEAEVPGRDQQPDERRESPGLRRLRCTRKQQLGGPIDAETMRRPTGVRSARYSDTYRYHLLMLWLIRYG